MNRKEKISVINGITFSTQPILTGLIVWLHKAECSRNSPNNKNMFVYRHPTHRIMNGTITSCNPCIPSGQLDFSTQKYIWRPPIMTQIYVEQNCCFSSFPIKEVNRIPPVQPFLHHFFINNLRISTCVIFTFPQPIRSGSITPLRNKTYIIGTSGLAAQTPMQIFKSKTKIKFEWNIQMRGNWFESNNNKQNKKIKIKI